jgi:hypothetical protein
MLFEKYEKSKNTCFQCFNYRWMLKNIRNIGAVFANHTSSALWAASPAGYGFGLVHIFVGL